MKLPYECFIDITFLFNKPFYKLNTFSMIYCFKMFL